MKSKIKLRSKINIEEIYLLIFLIVPTIVLFNQNKIENIILLMLFIIIFIIIIYKIQKNLLLLYLVLLILIIIPIINNEINYKQHLEQFNNKEFNNECLIIDLIEKDDYQKITFKSKKIRFIGTIKKTEQTKQLLIGQRVIIKGKLVKPNRYFTDPDFNYQEMLKKQKINGLIEIDKLELVNKVPVNPLVIKNLNLLLSRYIDYSHPFESKTFLKTLIIGNDEIESSLKNDLNLMGISHLFVISGMHFSLIILLIDKALNWKIFKKIKHPKVVKTLILILYIIITKFAISVMRCFIQNIIKMNNDKLRLNNFNQFVLSLMVMILLFPFSIYRISFVLTFLISGGITLVIPLLEKIEGKIKKMVFLTIFINLLTLPVISKMNANINLLVIVFNLFYVPFVSSFLFPLSMLNLIFPFLGQIYYYVYQFFIKTVGLINNFPFLMRFNLILPKIPLYLIILYYVVFIMFYQYYLQKNKKTISYGISLIIIIIIWNNFSIFNVHNQCTFINVKVGDATLIEEKNGKNNILIDTGKSDEIIPYLKQRGIKKIDYLIISHPDEDHNGQIRNLQKHFKIKYLVLSEYDLETSKLLDKQQKIIILKAGMKIKIGTIVIDCLGPIKDYHNKNNNSLVFILKINNLSILFTGDISQKAEIDLINKYKIVVDILKISHHGSKGSTSEEFIKGIKFDIAIAMNGYQNTFSFPHQEVIKRLNDKTLYNTIDTGTIVIKDKKIIFGS